MIIENLTNDFCLHELVEMINQIYEDAEMGIWKPSFKRIEEAHLKQLIEKNEIIIATQQGRLVGCIHFSTEEDDSLSFGLLAVSPHYRHLGIGRHLIQEVESQCIVRGLSKVCFYLLWPYESDHPQKILLRHWYEMLGYKEFSEYLFSDVAPDLVEHLKTPSIFKKYIKEVC